MITTLNDYHVLYSYQINYTDYSATSSSLISPSGLNSVIPLEIKMLYQATNFLISATYTRSRSKLGNTSAKYSRNCSGVAFFGSIEAGADFYLYFIDSNKKYKGNSA